MSGRRRGGCCCCTARGRVCFAVVLLLLAALLGYLSSSAVQSARAYAAAEVYLDNCKTLGQTPGGACGWTCVQVGDVCEWCTSPPSVLNQDINRTCVGNPSGASQPAWYPLPPTVPGQCSQPARSGTCSQCQYEAGNGTAVLLACAGAASLVAAAIAGGCCSTCAASCGSVCCINTCLCCGVTLGGGSLSLGIGGVLIYTGDCCRGGCRCCGNDCLEAQESVVIVLQQAGTEGLLEVKELER